MIRANGTPAGHVTFQALGGDVPSQSHSSEWDGVPAPAEQPSARTVEPRPQSVGRRHLRTPCHRVAPPRRPGRRARRDRHRRGAVVHIDARRHSYWRRLDAGNLSLGQPRRRAAPPRPRLRQRPRGPPPPRPAYTVPDQPPCSGEQPCSSTPRPPPTPSPSPPPTGHRGLRHAHHRGPSAAAIVRDILRWWPDALDRIVEEPGA